MEISTKAKIERGQSRRLLDYMAQRFTYRSLADWQALIAAEQVQVNGTVADLETHVLRDDVITTRIPDPDPPPADYSYTVVYEDEWLLGVNKPANLRVHGRGRFIHANLIHHLRHVRRPAYPRADLVNRLDANTSGLVLIAKNKEMMAHLQMLFRERRIEKRYLALVKGSPTPPSGTIGEPIGRLPSLDGVYRFGNGPEVEKSKPAVTDYRLLESYEEGVTLVELFPKTGRTHQLRVHLAGIGTPIIGDMLYQLSDEAFLAYCDDPAPFDQPLLGRQALHCAGYRFYHPFLDREFEIDAPLVEDMAGLIQRLTVGE